MIGGFPELPGCVCAGEQKKRSGMPGKRRNCGGDGAFHLFLMDYHKEMERIGVKARSFKEAAEADIRQHLAMTPTERMRAARELKDRMYPGNNPDIREWHRQQKEQ